MNSSLPEKLLELIFTLFGKNKTESTSVSNDGSDMFPSIT